MTKKKLINKNELLDVSTNEKILEANKFRFHDVPIRVKCLNEKQKELKNLIENQEITLVRGPAGTGKTFISLITALYLMKTNPKYKKLILVKSLVTIEDEEVGFLPGTLEDKLAPFMYSFTGNLDKILGMKELRKKLFEKEIIEFAPIAYVRGVTMDDCIVIIDEIQNINMHTFKTIITRIGNNCKMVFLGDVEQIDRKYSNESCLEKVIKMFYDKDFIGTIEFQSEDCVRNPIIPKILDVLNENDSLSLPSLSNKHNNYVNDSVKNN
ncbi:PhoH family protein [bacterium]|jgi:phosphate starvation-inducible PhoH-like protein|nr:PhoH family protein [bacterium]